MVNGETIQVRLTKQQKERAFLAMQNAGFKTMSSFIRSLILAHDLNSQNMIKAIYDKIVGDVRNGKGKSSIQG